MFKLNIKSLFCIKLQTKKTKSYNSKKQSQELHPMQSCTCRAGRLRVTCLTLNPAQISALMPLLILPTDCLLNTGVDRHSRSLPAIPPPPPHFPHFFSPCLSLSLSLLPLPISPPSFFSNPPSPSPSLADRIKTKALRTPIRGMTPHTFLCPSNPSTDRQTASLGS